MTIPNVAQCQAYHLLGVDQASSVANIVNPAAPLNVNGTPSYESYCSLQSGNAGDGFATPFTGAAYNRCCIGFYTDDYQNIATPGVPTAAAFNGTVEPMSWNANAQFLRWIGSTFTWRQSSAIDLPGSTQNMAPAHWFFPDGNQRRSKFRGVITIEDLVNATLWWLNGTVWEKTSTPVGASPPAVAASVTRIGFAGTNANTRWRTAAFAQFTALTDAQALASAAYIQNDLENRGIDF